MTLEAKELYFYCTTVEPFCANYKNLHTVKARSGLYYSSAKNTVREIVNHAVKSYTKEYCSKGKKCFTEQDRDSVCYRLLSQLFDL